MHATFDIFQKLPNGDPLWVKAVDGLEEAKAQLADLEAASCAEYFIYNLQRGCVVEVGMTAQA